MADKKAQKPINVGNNSISTASNGNKAISLTLTDAEGNKTRGKIFVSENQVHLDKKTENLPEKQQSSLVYLSPDKDYNFSVKAGKDENGKQQYNKTKISGADIIAQKAEQSIHVSGEMIGKTNNGCTRVSVGLSDADGKSQVKNVFVREDKVQLDPKTADKPKEKQGYYVEFTPDWNYDVSVANGKDENGKTLYDRAKLSGADIVEQNNAYMKEQNKQRTKGLEESVEQSEPQAEAQAEA